VSSSTLQEASTKDSNGDLYPYTLQARDQTEFTADFETA
jgi:hypothetical protein